jgi:hypothetical protein
MLKLELRGTIKKTNMFATQLISSPHTPELPSDRPPKFDTPPKLVTARPVSPKEPPTPPTTPTLETPDPFAFTQTKSSSLFESRINAPPAPRKIQTTQNPTALKLKETIQQIKETKQCSWKGESYALKLLGKGEHCVAYETEKQDLVVKIFSGSLQQKGPAEALNRLTAQLKNYGDMETTDLLKAKLLNATTALQDGFTIWEKINGKRYDAILSERPPSNAELKQIKDILKIAHDKQLTLDFKPDNLILNSNGQLILIDIYEYRDPDESRALIAQSMRKFVGNKETWNYLRPDDSYDYNF